MIGMAFCDVSHIVDDKYKPPIPYHFQYEAGRAPGHVDSKYLIFHLWCSARLCSEILTKINM